MIASAVVLPEAPVLLRELSGRVDVVPDLRVACHEALRAALAVPHDAVVVVSDDAAWWRPPPGPRDGRPLGLQVASRLLEEAVGSSAGTTHVALPATAGPVEVESAIDALGRRDERLVVVVAGDGSACRSETGPGGLDPGAFEFDDALAEALATGDRVALTGLDTEEARRLLVSGRAPFHVLAGAVAGPVRARLWHRDDPFGVTYLVATWVSDPAR